MKNIDFRNARPLVMMVSQYDYGYDLQVALWTNGEPVRIRSARIVSENFTTTCTVSDNVVTIPISASMTERFGHFPAEMRVMDAAGQVSSKNFDFFVERSPLAVKSTETYSGDIVEFTAKSVPLSSVVVTMEPIQSLNGYDAPWPAGGGKNLLDINNQPSASNEHIIICNLKLSAGTYTVSADAQSTSTGETLLVLFIYEDNTNSGNAYLRNGTRSSVTITATKAVKEVRFYSGTNYSTSQSFALELENAQVEAGSTATAFEPYSNICPISGRTGASVFVGSKNKAVLPTSTITRNGVVFTPNADGTISANGTVTTRGWVYTGGATIPLSNFGLAIGDTVTISINSGNRLAVIFRDDSATIGGSIITTTTPTTAIVPVGTKYVQVYFYAGQTQQEVGTVIDTTIKAQLEKGSTATEWTPYKSTTYPITFTSAGTVYAGTVDLVSGKLVVTHSSITIDETMNINLESTRFYVGRYDCKRQEVYTPETVRCDRLPTVAYEDEISFDSPGVTAYRLRSIFPGRNWICFSSGDASITTVAQMKEWLADNPLQVVYELVEPLTYTLTPTQVMSLLGENIVWSPDGEVTVVVPEFYS